MIKRKLIINLFLLLLPLSAYAGVCPPPVSESPEYNPKFASFKNLTLNNETINSSLCIEENLIIKGSNKLNNKNTDLIVYGEIIGNGNFINQKVNFYHNLLGRSSLKKMFSQPDLVVESRLEKNWESISIVLVGIFKRIGVTFFCVLLMYLFFYHFMSWVRKRKNLPYRPHPPMRQLMREWGVSVIASMTLLLILSYFDNFMPYVPYTNLYSDWSKFPSWYIPVSFFLVLFAYDTTFYWGHRVLHRFDWFYKYMHVVHHASKQPNPFTSFSFNPIEICFNYFIFLLVAMAIPMHFEVLKAFFTFNMIFSIYHHCGYEVIPRRINVWLNRYVGLVTPSYHNIHHSKYKYHFSFVFTYWDKICGTYYPDWQKDNIYVFEGLWDKKPKQK